MSKIYNRCVIEACRNTNSQSYLSYHTYPRDKVMRQKWLDAIAAGVGTKPLDLNSSRICSKHFLQTDYFPTICSQRKRLKPFAIPSIFENTKVLDAMPHSPTGSQTVPKEAFGHMSPEDGTQLLEEMGALHVDPEELNQLRIYANHPEEVQPQVGAAVISPVSSSTASSGISLKSTYTPYTPRKQKLLRNELELLSLRSKKKFTVTKFIDSDKSIKYYTGFGSYGEFWSFYQLLMPECFKLNYVGQDASQTTDNRDKEFFELVKPGKVRKLNPMEEFFMTLVRLRRGIEEQFLADLYNLSQGYVSRIINTWILFLFNRVPQLPIWASKERANELTNIKEIKEKYPGLRLIVDCTEFTLQRPSASEAQRESFSAYKHSNTAKALIGIAGAGHITYCSNLYAGRTSDKKIILHCGVLDMLEEGDVIMADRGFDIATELAAKKIKLIIPEFLRQRDQFTSTELSESRSVAVARIHIERAIGRIREFKILKRDIPLALAPMLQKIYIVCSYLSNFTGHLVANVD